MKIERRRFNPDLLVTNWTKKHAVRSTFALWFKNFIAVHNVKYSDIEKAGICGKQYYEWQQHIKKPKLSSIRKMSYALASATGISSNVIYKQAVKARAKQLWIIQPEKKK